MDKENNKIEIVSGDGSNLDISPVYEHLESEKPKNNKPKNIVIPKVNKDLEKKNHEDKSENEEEN